MNIYAELLNLGIDPAFVDAVEFAAIGGAPSPQPAEPSGAAPATPKLPTLSPAGPGGPATPKPPMPKIPKTPAVPKPPKIPKVQPTPHVAIHVHAPKPPKNSAQQANPVLPNQQPTQKPIQQVAPKPVKNASGTGLAKVYAGRLGASSGITPQNNQLLFGQAKSMGMKPNKVEAISQYVTAWNMAGSKGVPPLPPGVTQADINAYRASSAKWPADPTKDALVQKWFNQAFDANGNVVANPPPLPTGLSFTDIVNWNNYQSGDFTDDAFESPKAPKPLH